jgi:glycosyltransferase involved in cell wall biosynthesis
MKILQVSNLDNVGGAARIAWLLHQGYKVKRHAAWMAVGIKYSTDPDVFQIPESPLSSVSKWLYRKAEHADRRSARFLLWTQGGILRRIASPRKYFHWSLGIENFDFPNSRKILQLPPAFPDIIHFHNLHQDYFDLGYLPTLSTAFPSIITLHDTWMLSGHCAYSLDCERWRIGCGNCPYLGIYPEVRRDATRYNWRRKRNIYCRSRLYIAAPSRWVIDRVESSMLFPSAIETRVIHNGVDLNVFRPFDRAHARKSLGLPLDARILLFVAGGAKRNPYKDYQTIESAVRKISETSTGHKILVLALGENGMPEFFNNVEIRFVPFSSDLGFIANCYQASDIYVHAAKADTFPNVILEALACGVPVVATEVGGIPEQVLEGITGYLVPQGDFNAMATRIVQLCNDDELRYKMGYAATQDARRRFSLIDMVDAYLEWYQIILEQVSEKKSRK